MQGQKEAKSNTNGKRRTAALWDKKNMHSFTCRVRTYEANLFNEYCILNNTTPYKVLKNCVLSCINEYTNNHQSLPKNI